MPLYDIGDRVTQPQYGDGTVKSVDTYHTKIDFDEHGLRTFASERVVLAPASTVRPERPARRPRKSKSAKQT